MTLTTEAPVRYDECMRTRFRLRGFTLIELLVVVAIIALLIGLLMPAVIASINTAKKNKVRAEVKNLHMAWEKYYHEYSIWPADYAGAEQERTTEGQAVDILSGRDEPNNSRNIAFLDLPQRAITQRRFVDAWQRPFRFVLDTDYNDRVTVHSNTIKRVVAVWSVGRDGIAETKDDLVSWE